MESGESNAARAAQGDADARRADGDDGGWVEVICVAAASPRLVVVASVGASVGRALGGPWFVFFVEHAASAEGWVW